MGADPAQVLLQQRAASLADNARESHFAWDLIEEAPERWDGLAEMKDVQRDRMNLGRPVRPQLKLVFRYISGKFVSL
jgi:hypothetical protein